MHTRRAAVAAVFLAFFLTSTAHASNFCLSFGSARVVASGLTIPVKGTCTTFNGFYANRPGLLLAGDVCRSSNGTTFLFNTFTQFNKLPDTLAGTWAASNGAGSGNECSSAGCNSFAVAVTKCPLGVPIPADLPGFESETPSSFLTQEP